jgi:hypothetical protein
VLADLECDDPKFAFPAARLVGLYQRLWEMIPVPAEKSGVEPAACRGEAEVRPSLFSGVYQPPIWQA